MKYQIRKSCFETNSSSMHTLVLTKKNQGVRMTREEIRKEFYLDEPWYVDRHKGEKEIVEVGDKYCNEYGRSPFDVLSTFREKLNYAIAEYCGNNYENIKSYLKGEEYFDDVIKPLVISLIGCDDVEVEEDTAGFYIYSDVDTEHLDEAEQVPYSKLVYLKEEDRIDEYECYSDTDVDGRPVEYATFKVPCFGGIDHQSVGRLRTFLAKHNLTLEDYLVRKDIVVLIDGDEYCILSRLINCGLVSKSNIVNNT